MARGAGAARAGKSGRRDHVAAPVKPVKLTSRVIESSGNLVNRARSSENRSAAPALIPFIMGLDYVRLSQEDDQPTRRWGLRLPLLS